MNTHAVVYEPGKAMPIPQREVSSLSLVHTAIERGASVEIIERMMDLAEKDRARRAAQAFNAAMALAMADMPAIPMRGFNSQTRSKYAKLPDALQIATPVLARHGLRIWFDMQTADDLMTVTCVVAHADGHEQRVTQSAPRLKAPVGRESGRSAMNPLQEAGATQSYLARYTLQAALALAMVDEDTDGRHPADLEPSRPAPDTSDIQAAIARSLSVDDLGKVKPRIATVSGEDGAALRRQYNVKLKQITDAAAKADPETGELSDD